MIEFDCEEVKRQLNRLAEALPNDEVAIWLCVNPVGLSYTCYIQSRDGLPCGCGTDKVVAVAVNEAIRTAGPRGGNGIIRVKREAIEKARLELAKLESELDPLVMAVDKAQSDSQPQPSN